MNRSQIRVLLSTSCLFVGAYVQAAPIVPAYSSRPGASATLFLDLDGRVYSGTWGGATVGTVAAYDVDGDPTTFSSQELTNILQIWSRVAEAFSPFNINVTTVDPGNFNVRQSAHVVIGGNNTFVDGIGGVAFYRGFVGGGAELNTAWVSSTTFPNVINTAGAAAHEAGHLFGLAHQAKWSGTTKIADYDPGDSFVGPIMGSANSTRYMWRDGPTDAAYNDYQDNLAILASTAANPVGGYYNGFGYAADDYNNTAAFATALNPTGATTFTANGVIGMPNDVDYFSFTTGAGNVNIVVNRAQYGGMLDVRLQLFDASGTLLGTYDPNLAGGLGGIASDFGLRATINTTLSAGTYYLAISGHADYITLTPPASYDNVGQWRLTGTVASSVMAIPEPAGAAFPVLVGGLLVRRRR